MTDTETTIADLPDNPYAAIGVKVGDEQLVLRPGMVGVALSSQLRQQSRGAWRTPTLFAAMAEGIGPEEFAGMLFLARRQAKQLLVTYDSVIAEVDAMAASDHPIAVIYERGVLDAEVLAAAPAVIDFTWNPSDGSPEA